MSSKPTIQSLVDGLTALAETLPDGVETPFRIGICDGEDLQMIGRVDIREWTRVRKDGTPEDLFVLIRAHQHPGEESAELMRGAAVDVDDELRQLADNPHEE